MVDAARHPNIEILAYSEVDKVDGYIGNFRVQVTKQAVPLIYAIDMDNCIECYQCVTACGKLDAIDFSQEPETLELEVGAIITATGFESFDPSVIPELGYGVYPNVITAMELERLANSAGPTIGPRVWR